MFFIIKNSFLKLAFFKEINGNSCFALNKILNKENYLNLIF